MKKTIGLFFLIFIIALTGCNSKHENSKNSKYVYGTFQNGDISSVYTLVGNPSQYSLQDYTEGVGKGAIGSYFINVCETESGGVVAYGEGMYVYSPDKNDKNDVKNS